MFNIIILNIIIQLKDMSRVFKPWGYYDDLLVTKHYVVKRLVVKSANRLSLQYHKHRIEHLMVVKGKAYIELGDNILNLEVGQRCLVNMGQRHRICNYTNHDLVIIEVQISYDGDPVRETDIVRLEDDYKRI